MTLDRILGLKKVTALAVFIVVFAISSMAGAVIMNGKEVQQHVGNIVSHNDRTGEVVIKTDNSTGHFKVSHRTAVFFGKERLTLADIWGKTKKVKAHVSQDGEIQRITVLEWK
jgi:uncharacterized alkaline shock family protein YloU